MKVSEGYDVHIDGQGYRLTPDALAALVALGAQRQATLLLRRLADGRLDIVPPGGATTVGGEPWAVLGKTTD